MDEKEYNKSTTPCYAELKLKNLLIKKSSKKLCLKEGI